MEVIVLCLLLTLIGIFLFPDDGKPTPTIQEKHNETMRLNHCKDLHKWEVKPSGFEGVNYTVCVRCKYVPEVDGYEA